MPCGAVCCRGMIAPTPVEDRTPSTRKPYEEDGAVPRTPRQRETTASRCMCTAADIVNGPQEPFNLAGIEQRIGALRAQVGER